MFSKKHTEEIKDLLALALDLTGAEFAWLAQRPKRGRKFAARVTTGDVVLPKGWESELDALADSESGIGVADLQDPDGKPRLTFESGSRPWRFFAGVPVREENGKTTRALAIAGTQPVALDAKSRAAIDRLARQFARAIRTAEQGSELRDAKRRYEQVTEQFNDTERIANIGHWQLDLESGALNWSDEVYRIFGLEPASFGETFEAFLSFVHPDDRPAFLEAQERGVRGEAPLAHEHRIVRPDGAIRYVLERGELLPPNEVQGRRFAGVVLDITRRREAELALAREEARYRAFFDHSPDLVFVHRNNRIEHINRAGLELLGLKSQERVVGRSPFEFVHPDDREAVAERSRKLMEDAPATLPTQVIRVILPDGKTCSLEVRSSSFRTPDGGVSVQAICHDVTNRIEMEKRLEENARMMEIATRLARMGAWRVDMKEGRLHWSDEVAVIHGYEPGFSPSSLDEAINYYAPEDRDRITRVFSRCATEGIGFDEELCLVDKAGDRIMVRAIGHPEYGENGRIVGVHGAFQDISEQKIAEAELRRRDRELEGAVERLTTTLESITDAFFTVDINWRFTYVNGEAERLLHSRRAELLGQEVWEVFSAARGTAFESEYRRAMEEQVSVSFEAYYPPLASWFEVNAYPSVEGLAVYFRDVTKRRKSEERMRFLETCVERMNDIVMVTEAWPIDEPGPRITFVNKEFERLTGYKSEEVIGLNPRILQGPDTDRAELDRIRSSLERLEPVRSVIVNYGKEGRPYWLEMNIVPLENENGTVTHFLAVERDVTERKQRQEALREREQALSILMNNLPGLVYLCDARGYLIRWNSEVERALGYPGEALERIHVLNLMAPRYRDRTRQRIEQVFRDGFAEDTLVLRTKSGAEIPFFFRAGRIMEGGEQRLLGVAVDLSERLSAEARIRHQAALLDQTQDAIFTVGKDGFVSYWNKAAERLYGWSQIEAVDRLQAKDLFAEREQWDAIVRSVKESGSWSGNANQRDRSGQSLQVESRWTLLSDEGNGDSAFSILAVNTDVSEKRRLEQQFLRAQRMEAIGTLAGGIAHDLNNILSPILLSIDLLRARSKDPRDQRTLATIESAGKRGSEIIKQVLSFARGLGGERVAAAPKHIVNEVASLLRETFPRSIEFSTQIDRNAGVVLVDPTQLHQALMNLCVNARDAMPEGGKLTLSAQDIFLESDTKIGGFDAKAGRYVKLSVADTGSGMTDEVKRQLFEPFFSTKREGEGTGLGLPTVQGIVKGHNGFLEVESELGKGSVFSIWFPALADGDAEPESEPLDGLPRGSGETILVVDDEESVRIIAEETFGDFGYEVLLAENGAKALSTYHKNRDRIRVLVTDIMMPVMDGATLIRGVRRSDPQLPVIITSGFTAESSKAREIEQEAGARVIPKPYTAETMLKALRSVIAAKG